MSKKCIGCQEVLEFSKFSSRSDKVDHPESNPAKYSSYCLECQSLNTKIKFFGITKDVFENLRETHQDCCAICGAHEIEGRVGRNKYYGLCIDHCHSTGEVRGLLCNSCNLILGHAKDSVEKLQRAISYLNR